VVARDVAGNTAKVTRSVNLDTTPPILILTVPAAGSRVLTNVVHVTGTTEADAAVTVDGISASVASGGDFSVDIVLPDGSHTITAVATDPAGNQATAVTRSVTYHSPVPGINQAVTSLSGNLVLGLAIVIVVLVAIVFALYWNLNRKIGNLKPRPPEPPEGGMP